MTDERIDRAAADIKELIEVAAFNPERWEDFIETIWRQLPGTQVVLHTLDEITVGTSPLLLRGWEAAHIESYVSHYAALNPWVRARALAPAMVPVWTEDTVPALSFKNSEFYTDWLSKSGDTQCATGFKLLHEQGRSASLDIHYGLAHAEANHRLSRRLLNVIGPSLHRSISALRLRQKREGKGVLDMLLEAAFIVAENSNIIDLNTTAQEFIDEGIVVLRAPKGRLSVRSASADQALYHEVACLYRSDPGNHSGSTIRVTTADELLLLSIFPIIYPGPSQTTITSLFPPRRAALVVIRRRPLRYQSDDTQRFAAQFSLTPAETRLAKALKDGSTLREAAELNNISYETARGHLRGIFGKSGIQRQIDLVRALIHFEK